MKKRYDLIFGIGQACSCSQVLRQSELQQFSYPLDWLCGNNFEGRINILYSDFKRFIEKDDLECQKGDNGDRDNLCEIYRNNFNQIVFNHDFPYKIPLDESYQTVKSKYDRRISRLLNQIDNSKSILIVYVEYPMEQDKLKDNEVLVSNFDKILKKYPDKTIDLLYFSNDMSYKAGKYKEEKITERITKVVGHYKSTNKKDIDIIVSPKFFRKFFKNYELNLKPEYRIKRAILNALVPLIPIKSIRKSMRKKYHIIHK